MNYQEILNQGSEILRANNIKSSNLDCELILSKILNKPREEILINLEKYDSNIILSIDDDGPGIPKSEYQNIVKPFYKIDKSRSESKSSVGLGLAISSDIIKSHGGDIKFDKSKMGGLKVIISLPF